MSSALVAVCLVAIVALVSGEVTLNGNCPNWTPQQNVQSSRLAGDWIGLYSLQNGKSDPISRCVRSSHQVAANGVFTTTVHFTRANNNQHVTKTLTGTPIDGQNGKLAYQDNQNAQKTSTFTVLKTDYDNYLVAAICKNVAGKHGYSVVIYSHQQTLAPQLLQEAKDAIQAANINQQVEPISQQNCNANN